MYVLYIGRIKEVRVVPAVPTTGKVKWLLRNFKRGFKVARGHTR